MSTLALLLLGSVASCCAVPAAVQEEGAGGDHASACCDFSRSESPASTTQVSRSDHDPPHDFCASAWATAPQGTQADVGSRSLAVDDSGRPGARSSVADSWRLSSRIEPRAFAAPLFELYSQYLI